MWDPGHGINKWGGLKKMCPSVEKAYNYVIIELYKLTRCHLYMEIICTSPYKLNYLSETINEWFTAYGQAYYY